MRACRAANSRLITSAQRACAAREPRRGAPLALPVSWSSWCANSCSTTLWPSSTTRAPSSTSCHDRITWPCDHDSPASARRSSRSTPPGDACDAVDHERARIDQDLLELGKQRAAAVQAQQAGLGGDGHAHLVGDLQPGAAQERLLGQEHEDAPAQLLLQIGRQLPIQGNATPQDACATPPGTAGWPRPGGARPRQRGAPAMAADEQQGGDAGRGRATWRCIAGTPRGDPVAYGRSTAGFKPAGRTMRAGLYLEREPSWNPLRHLRPTTPRPRRRRRSVGRPTARWTTRWPPAPRWRRAWPRCQPTAGRRRAAPGAARSCRPRCRPPASRWRASRPPAPTPPRARRRRRADRPGRPRRSWPPPAPRWRCNTPTPR